ncbi:MAG: hypothetical protein JNM89_11420 [Hyphomicrobiaceae bacterium]|nr:hypothetical protein [Hyphomicrobiaceae bacterium]
MPYKISKMSISGLVSLSVLSIFIAVSDGHAAPGGNGNGNAYGLGNGNGTGNAYGLGGGRAGGGNPNVPGGGAPLPALGVTLLGQAAGAAGLFALWRRRRSKQADARRTSHDHATMM